MLRLTLSLILILSASAIAQTERNTFEPVKDHDETVEVFQCDFEESSDANYDLWPDGWTRRRGRGYPAYINVEITDRPTATSESKRCLRIDLDGGAVSMYSPFIEVSPLFSYSLSGFLKTAELINDEVVVEVIFYDRDRQVIESTEPASFTHEAKWKEVLIGPVTPSHQNVRWAAIAIHLKPKDRADLTGKVWFDDISFGRLPRMSLSTNNEHNIYAPDKQVEITCRLSGYTGYEPHLRFELLDVDGKLLESHQEHLQAITKSRPPKNKSNPELQNKDDENGFLGASRWQPRIEENGFYQVRVSVHGHRGLTRTVNLVVVDPAKKTLQGEFGWSLPDGDEKLPLKKLASLLSHVGINWVKFPIWYDNDQRAEQLAWFAEHVGINNIEMVGMLSQPPQSLRGMFGEQGPIQVAAVFVDAAVWGPAIDAVMTRLSLKIRWWQLGDDQDISFVNYPQLIEKLIEIRDGFNRFGQEINLGTTWRSIDETPFSLPLTFLSYTADPPLTANEQREHLAAVPSDNLQRWVVLEPIHGDEYSLETKARDLVERMLAAKMGRATGIFVPRPFDEKHGLMKPDGTPGPLLLPWRMTAEMTAGAEYLGKITLPNGSSNYIFERDGQAVMVVWNATPTTETIYLGEKIKQFDLWGRMTVPNELQGRDDFKQQEIQVGTLPTFVTGVNPIIAKWRMSVEFETKELESVFGQRQRATYYFSNVFRQGVGGSVSLTTPPVWIVDGARKQFKLFSDERREQKIGVTLGTNASSGPQNIRLDFNLSADRNYRFSVYRQIQIGLGDIELEMESHLDEHGNLIVEQHLTNKTDRFISFNCLLFVPDRRRERHQVFDLGRGRHTTQFVIRDGAELIGLPLGLRAEEIGGARVLNHRFIAEE